MACNCVFQFPFCDDVEAHRKRISEEEYLATDQEEQEYDKWLEMRAKKNEEEFGE
jgi:hypothetical protein